jgi:hypothetical protein
MTLKEFEGTGPIMRYQIPKQKYSRKLATIITSVNQNILQKYVILGTCSIVRNF